MRNIYIASLFILLAQVGISQTGVHIGAAFMPQATWLLNDELEGGEFTFGTAYGATFNVHFGHKWGVGADVLLSNEGQKFTNNQVESQIEVNYLKIPILLHFNSDPNAGTPFLFEIGVQFASVTGAKLTVDGEEVVDENGDRINAEDMFKSSNLGGVLAAGPGFHIGDHLLLTTMVRVDMQFSDAIDENSNLAIFSEDRKETYPLTAGIKLGLKWVIGEGAGYD